MEQIMDSDYAQLGDVVNPIDLKEIFFHLESSDSWDFTDPADEPE